LLSLVVYIQQLLLLEKGHDSIGNKHITLRGKMVSVDKISGLTVAVHALVLLFVAEEGDWVVDLCIPVSAGEAMESFY
jgi:hypothetical protein